MKGKLMETMVHAERVAPAVGAAAFLAIMLLSILLTVLAVVVYCMIFHKAGYSWALGLLMLVPIANIIMVLVLAFGDWPIRKELRRLRQQRTAVP
jgi:hypothetical protein